MIKKFTESKRDYPAWDEIETQDNFPGNTIYLTEPVNFAPGQSKEDSDEEALRLHEYGKYFIFREELPESYPQVADKHVMEFIWVAKDSKSGVILDIESASSASTIKVVTQLRSTQKLDNIVLLLIDVEGDTLDIPFEEILCSCVGENRRFRSVTVEADISEFVAAKRPIRELSILMYADDIVRAEPMILYALISTATCYESAETYQKFFELESSSLVPETGVESTQLFKEI